MAKLSVDYLDEYNFCKLLSKYDEELVVVYKYHIKDNYLYVLYSVNMFTYKIIKIDLDEKTILSDNFVVLDDGLNYRESYFIKNNFYMLFKHRLLIYDLEYNLVETINYKCIEEKIRVDIMVNDIIYYSNYDKNEDIYNIVDFNNNTLIKLKLSQESVYFKDNILHLPYDRVFIENYKNILIIYYRLDNNVNNKYYIEYNLSNNEFKINYYNIDRILQGNKFIYLKYDVYYIHNVINKTDIKLHEYNPKLGKSEPIIKVVDIFEHNNKKYCLEHVQYICEDKSGETYKSNINLYIDTK